MLPELLNRGFATIRKSELAQMLSDELNEYLELCFPSVQPLHRLQHLDEIDYASRKSILKAYTLSKCCLSHIYSSAAVSIYSDFGIEVPTLERMPVTHFLGPLALSDAKERSLESKLITPPHQDIVVTVGSSRQIVLFLVPYCSSMASLRIWPGSHRHGLLPWKEDPFGHRVVDTDSLGLPVDIAIRPGEILVFSNKVVHSTIDTGNLRLAVSWRIDDLSDPEWKRNGYARISPMNSRLSAKQDLK